MTQGPGADPQGRQLAHAFFPVRRHQELDQDRSAGLAPAPDVLPVQGGDGLELQVPEDVRQRRFDAVTEREGQSFEAGDIDIVSPRGPLEVQDHAEFALICCWKATVPTSVPPKRKTSASGECGQEAACAAVRRSVVAGSQDPDEAGLVLLQCPAVGVRPVQSVQPGEQFVGFRSDVALPHFGADPVLVVPEVAALDGNPGWCAADVGHGCVHEKPPEVVIGGVAGVAVELEIVFHGYTTISSTVV